MIKNLRVTVDGQPFDVTVEIPDEPQPAASSTTPLPEAAVVTAAAGDIPSPLSGHVVSITVTVGQEVKKGDTMLSIEAMKMNTAVLAPNDGKVAVVHVKVGDAVRENQPLVRLG